MKTTKTINVPSYGIADAIEACELQPGMACICTGGIIELVDSVEISKTGKTCTIKVISNGEAWTRRRNAHTLVAVNLEVVDTIVFDRLDGTSGACNTDDENAESTYAYYRDLMRTEGAYSRVTWERSTNGGNTWTIVEREERTEAEQVAETEPTTDDLIEAIRTCSTLRDSLDAAGYDVFYTEHTIGVTPEQIAKAVARRDSIAEQYAAARHHVETLNAAIYNTTEAETTQTMPETLEIADIPAYYEGEEAPETITVEQARGMMYSYYDGWVFEDETIAPATLVAGRYNIDQLLDMSADACVYKHLGTYAWEGSGGYGAYRFATLAELNEFAAAWADCMLATVPTITETTTTTTQQVAADATKVATKSVTAEAIADTTEPTDELRPTTDDLTHWQQVADETAAGRITTFATMTEAIAYVEGMVNIDLDEEPSDYDLQAIAEAITCERVGRLALLPEYDELADDLARQNVYNLLDSYPATEPVRDYLVTYSVDGTSSTNVVTGTTSAIDARYGDRLYSCYPLDSVDWLDAEKAARYPHVDLTDEQPTTDEADEPTAPIGWVERGDETLDVWATTERGTYHVTDHLNYLVVRETIDADSDEEAIAAAAERIGGHGYICINGAQMWYLTDGDPADAIRGLDLDGASPLRVRLTCEHARQYLDTLDRATTDEAQRDHIRAMREAIDHLLADHDEPTTSDEEATPHASDRVNVATRVMDLWDDFEPYTYADAILEEGDANALRAAIACDPGQLRGLLAEIVDEGTTEQATRALAILDAIDRLESDDHDDHESDEATDSGDQLPDEVLAVLGILEGMRDEYRAEEARRDASGEGMFAFTYHAQAFAIDAAITRIRTRYVA